MVQVLQWFPRRYDVIIRPSRGFLIAAVPVMYICLAFWIWLALLSVAEHDYVALSGFLFLAIAFLFLLFAGVYARVYANDQYVGRTLLGHTGAPDPSLRRSRGEARLWRRPGPLSDQIMKSHSW